MPQSDYEKMRGAIEAASNHINPVQQDGPSLHQQIADLKQENQHLQDTVRRLEAELAESKQREAFLWETMQFFQFATEFAEEQEARKQAEGQSRAEPEAVDEDSWEMDPGSFRYH